MKFTQLGNMAILAAIVHGQVASERLVGDINAITDLSSQTEDLTQSISITNFFSTGPVSPFYTLLRSPNPNPRSLGIDQQLSANNRTCLQRHCVYKWQRYAEN